MPFWGGGLARGLCRAPPKRSGRPSRRAPLWAAAVSYTRRGPGGASSRRHVVCSSRRRHGVGSELRRSGGRPTRRCSGRSRLPRGTRWQRRWTGYGLWCGAPASSPDNAHRVPRLSSGLLRGCAKAQWAGGGAPINNSAPLGGGGGEVPHHHTLPPPLDAPVPPPKKVWATFFSGPLANQKFSLAPSVSIGLDQTFSSAPLKTQHPRRGGGGSRVLSEMHCTTRRGVVQGVGARRVGSVRRVVQCHTRRRGPTRRGCTTRRTVSYKVSYSTDTVRHSTT